MRAIIKTNLNFYYRHLEQQLQYSKNTTHSCVFKSHIYFEPTGKKKVLVQKTKFPVTTSMTVHVRKIIMLENKKDEKCYLLQTKK